MSFVRFEDLPSESRLWIFGSDKELNHPQKELLTSSLNEFVTGWLSHKKDVIGGWKLEHDRFVIVGVDESTSGVSGCSIDSLMSAMKNIESLTGHSFLDTSGLVFYRDVKGQIRSVDRERFGLLVDRGEVTQETFVFDNTVATLKDYKAGRWEVPMNMSWHGKVFAVPA